MLGSLLVSVLLVGFKLNAAKDLVQTIERRKELKENIAVLQVKLELEEKLTWIDNATHDAAQREVRIGEMLAAPSVYSSMENEAIQRCLGMFALFESSSNRSIYPVVRWFWWHVRAVEIRLHWLPPQHSKLREWVLRQGQ